MLLPAIDYSNVGKHNIMYDLMCFISIYINVCMCMAFRRQRIQRNDRQNGTHTDEIYDMNICVYVKSCRIFAQKYTTICVYVSKSVSLNRLPECVK